MLLPNDVHEDRKHVAVRNKIQSELYPIDCKTIFVVFMDNLN
jgi:hypothetical protein